MNGTQGKRQGGGKISVETPEELSPWFYLPFKSANGLLTWQGFSRVLITRARNSTEWESQVRTGTELQ